MKIRRVRTPARLRAGLAGPAAAAGPEPDGGAGSRPRPERLDWRQDQGCGWFIHGSVGSQLGTVISHSLVGAADDDQRRFFAEPPQTFNLRKFHRDDGPALAEERSGAWVRTAAPPRRAPGTLAATAGGRVSGHRSEARARAPHPLLAVDGRTVQFSVP